jgi:hypothetical protein
MKMMELLSPVAPATKLGFMASATSIGGSLYAAIVSPDVIPVVGAMVLGVTGLGWSIYSAGRDRRVGTLMQEIDLIQGILKGVRSDLAESQADRRLLANENARMAGRLARLEGESGSHEHLTQ